MRETGYVGGIGREWEGKVGRRMRSRIEWEG